MRRRHSHHFSSILSLIFIGTFSTLTLDTFRDQPEDTSSLFHCCRAKCTSFPVAMRRPNYPGKNSVWPRREASPRARRPPIAIAGRASANLVLSPQTISSASKMGAQLHSSFMTFCFTLHSWFYCPTLNNRGEGLNLTTPI